MITRFRRTLLFALMLLGGLPSAVFALDAGIDPYNLGKGDWIWIVSDSETAVGAASLQGLIDYEKNQGMQWLTVKCGDGGSIYSQFNSDLITRTHNAGMKIFGWAYCRGTNLTGEISVALNCLNLGADGLIIDAEAEYENDFNDFNYANAIKYCQAIRAQYPNRFIAGAPSPTVYSHPTFPYLQFGLYTDATMPQCYWGYRGITPAQMLAHMQNQFRTNLVNKWTGSAALANKPLVPVAQADVSTVAGSDESDFVTLLQTEPNPVPVDGYHGVSFWDCQEHSAAQWTAIGGTNISLMTNLSPRIPFPPVNRCVDLGGHATFNVRAYGAPSPAYQWCFNGTAIPNATGNIYTVANAQLASAGNYSVVASNSFGSLTSSVAKLTVNVPFQNLQLVFADGFETNSAALWNLFQGSANNISDFTTNWAFDYSTQTYSAYGPNGFVPVTNMIPVAPGTTNGTRLGLKLAVNKNDGTAAQAGVSLYPKGLAAMSNCVLRFDAWINYNGGPGAGSGSTEMLACGLNHSGTRVNWLDVNSSSSDGTWFVVDGDGGSANRNVQTYSAGSDYRAYQGNGASAPTHLSFANSGLGINGAASEDCVDVVYGNLFAYPNYETPGVPGKHWVQVELSQRSGLLTWRMNGTVVAQRTNTSSFKSGNAMIGYLDPFASIASPGADNYVIIDNVRIYTFVDSPVILTQPVGLTVNVDSNAVFNVVAAGASPLNYQWQYNGTSIVGATNTVYAVTNVQFANAGNYSVVISNYLGSVTSIVAALTVEPSALFRDDFDGYASPSTVTSATATNGYKIFFGPASGAYDFTAIFGFDYSTVTFPTNIPIAPNSSSATTKGLYLTVNKDASGALAAVNLYPLSQSFTGNFSLKFDLWLNYGSVSTTEHALFGINHSGSVTNRVGQATSDGLFFAVDGDGGCASNSPSLRDYTVFRGGGSGAIPIITTNVGSFAFGPTPLLGTHFAAADAGFKTLFPAKPVNGGTAAGSAGLGWISVEVRQESQLITCLLNGVAIAQYTNSFAYTNGAILLGYNDNFSSTGDANNFAIFDNIRVESRTVVPAQILSPRIVGNNFSLGFTNEPYESYAVQWTTNLLAPNWTTLTNLVGNGVPAEVLVPLLPSNPAPQFFRVSRP